MHTNFKEIPKSLILSLTNMKKHDLDVFYVVLFWKTIISTQLSMIVECQLLIDWLIYSFLPLIYHIENCCSDFYQGLQLDIVQKRDNRGLTGFFFCFFCFICFCLFFCLFFFVIQHGKNMERREQKLSHLIGSNSIYHRTELVFRCVLASL